MINREEEVEREIQDLFRLDDRPGPARRLSSADADALISAAFAAAPPEVVSPRRRSTVPRLRFAAIAAAAFLVLGGASAVARWYVGPKAEPPPSEETPVARHGGTRRPAPPPPAPVVAPPIEPPAGETDEELVEEDSPVLDEDIEDVRVEPRRKRAATSRDLLRKANQLRGERRWREAERVYRKVTQIHPRSASAYVASIAAASLRLEHLGDPRVALALYRRARSIDPQGSLDAEARQGIAAAHRALGDSTGERRALEDLLEEHPNSAFAEGARARLDALRGGSR